MPGLLFRPSDPRFHERFVEGWRSTGVWPTASGLATRQLGLLSADGRAFQAVAVVTRGRIPAATYTWHIVFNPVLPFDAEIKIEEFINLLSEPTSETLRSGLGAGGALLSDEVLEEVLNAIITARPDAEDPVSEVLRILQDPPPLNDPSDDAEPIVLYEGDAVALALEIAGFDREQELRNWSGTPRAPFLEGIDEFRVSEEQLIDHDARHFGDLGIAADDLVGGVTFSSRGRHLTVFNVNHEPVEETLGVDLIYYNHNHDSYVLVQYKRMQRITGDSEFRPNAQLDDELARMRAVPLDPSAPQQTVDYRLGEGCCFLKLCWPTTKEFHAGEIAKGMYFPLAYWDLLIRSPVAVGERGGVRLLGNTVGRRLNRTAFVALVQDAWIGSRGVTSEAIEEAIRSGIRAKHSVILAAGRTR